jgi:hypothetical protein
MDLVYRHSTLTIAAHGAETSRDGCFARRNPLMLRACKFADASSERNLDIIVAEYMDGNRPWLDSRVVRFHEAPLCTRA